MSVGEFWERLIADNRAGRRRGIPSWCTAHARTLSAVFAAHRDSDEPILVEATCNQVNQFGGYTGMTPAAFRVFALDLAREAGIDPGRVMLGGDHLGPNPWRGLSARDAMGKARDMTRAYVEAGFSKIHLDASMRCADDAGLVDEQRAERAAELCAVAEAAGRGLVYVIGTEVPVPGGETETPDTLEVTRPEAALGTFALHRAAFRARGVAGAIERVIAIVAQPGVEFGNRKVFGFERAKAAALSASLAEMPGIVFEAHSTDYQSAAALADLVGAHFAILKVGPWLTYAFREAVEAMAASERRLPEAERANVIAALRRAMDENPEHWRPYVEPGEEPIGGLSDRVRYYWPDARVESAVRRLIANVGVAVARDLIQARVGAVVDVYRRACGAAGAHVM